MERIKKKVYHVKGHYQDNPAPNKWLQRSG